MHEAAHSGATDHPLLSSISVDRRPHELHFQCQLRSSSTALLTDHRIFGTSVLPAAAYLELALAAADRLLGATPASGAIISDAAFQDLLAVKGDDAVVLRVRIRRDGGDRARFHIESAPAPLAPLPAWRLHAQGAVEHAAGPLESGVDGSDGPPDRATAGEAFYRRAAHGPFQWGPTHRVVQSIVRAGHCLNYELRRVSMPTAPTHDFEGWLTAPLLDGCLQVPAMEHCGESADRASVPTRIDRAWFAPAGSHEVRVRCRPRERSDDSGDVLTIDLTAHGRSGEAVAIMRGVRFQSITRGAFEAAVSARRPSNSSKPAGAARTELRAELEAAAAADRPAVLSAFIERQVADLLKLKDPDPTTLQRGFFSIGLDSLLAIELQFRIQKALGFTLPPGSGLKFERIESLSAYLLNDVLALGG